MPRSSEQNRIIKDRRRAKLLRAALRVFAAKGYRGTSVDDITKEARCSHGLFYHYFESKADAYEAVLKELVIPSNAVPPLEEALAKHGDAGLALIGAYIEQITNGDKIQWASAMVYMGIGDGEEAKIAQKVGISTVNAKTALIELIKEGQEEGVAIEGDPEEIAEIVSSVILWNLQRKGSGVETKGISSHVFRAMMTKK